MEPIGELVSTRVLDAVGATYRVHRHAAVLGAEDHAISGLDPELSAKTLAFLIADDRLVLVAVPGLARLGYGQLARALGVSRSQLKAASAEQLERLGMQPGGVCPFSPDPSVQVVIDARVMGLPVVYCGSGDPRATIELTPEQLRLACPTAVIAEVTAPESA